MMMNNVFIIVKLDDRELSQNAAYQRRTAGFRQAPFVLLKLRRRQKFNIYNISEVISDISDIFICSISE